MSPKPVNTLWSATVVKNDNPIEYERMLGANRAKDEERRRHMPRTPEEQSAGAHQAKRLQEAKTPSLAAERQQKKRVRDQAANEK